jgi:hypothetical protein
MLNRGRKRSGECTSAAKRRAICVRVAKSPPGKRIVTLLPFPNRITTEFPETFSTIASITLLRPIKSATNFVAGLS